MSAYRARGRGDPCQLGVGRGGVAAAVPVRAGAAVVAPPAVGELGGCRAAEAVVGGGEAADLEALGGLDEAGELRLGHRGLALVHEVDDALHLPPAHVLQHDDRVLARVVDEDLLEIGAGREAKMSGC